MSLAVPTRVRWLEVTVEAIVLPFERNSTPEPEFEANFIWLPGERTRRWVSSHFDVVDKFSRAERPSDRRAYTHKPNLDLDTSVSIFNWLRERRWLCGVELERNLDQARFFLAAAYYHLGYMEEALSTATRSAAALAGLLAAVGDTASARRYLQDVLEDRYRDHHVAYSLGAAYAQLGEAAEALRWLRTAADSGFPCLPWFERDPLLEPVRKQPGFADVVAYVRNRRESSRLAVN